MTVKFTNNASSTLSSGINSSVTSLTVASASAFPQLAGADDYCYLTIQQATGTAREVVKATALSSNTFTIIRAQDNTTAQSFSAGDTVELRMTAALLTDVIDAATVEGVKTNFQYTPTAGQTVFSGADNSSNTMIINQSGLVNVYMNGVRLVQGTDYTVSAANNTITLTTGATTADIIDIEVYGNFTGQSGAAVAITGGSITGTAITATTLGASGTATLNTFVSNNATISGGTINNVAIGGTTQAAGAFTSLTSAGLTVDTNTLVVDATNNRVGIGASSPATKLDVSSTGEVISTIRSTSTSGARGAKLRLNVASTGGDDPAGTIEFTYGTGYTVAGSIAMSHTNPAMRFSTGTTERMRLTATGLGIGTSSPNAAADLHVADTSDTRIWIEATSGDTMELYAGTDVSVFNRSNNALKFGTNNTERMRIDSSGRVGIFNSSPADYTGAGARSLVVGSNSSASDPHGITIVAGSSSTSSLAFTDNAGDGSANDYRGLLQYVHSDDSLRIFVASSERMRISGGNLLVGRTSASFGSDTGIVFRPNNDSYIITNGTPGLTIRRNNSDGDLQEFYRDGTQVGTIVSRSGVVSSFVFDPRTNGSGLSGGTQQIQPANQNGAVVDNSIDLGSSTTRFKDLHLSGTMIGNLVKLRTIGGAMYVSPTNANTLNGNYDENTDEGDMWINYRGYQDTFDRFRDFRIGNGKGAVIVLVDGSASSVAITGSLSISSSLSKGSGSFKIDHPLPAKTETHHLVHSFVEAPQADNIYRGKVDLVGGSATVNIDTAAGMTEGTYVLLNTNTQCFTSNESGWTAVKGSVSGNTLTITAQDNTCTDTISWMVVGERHDQHMIDTDWTDDNGKVIVEPLKENN